jgi:hypothetical protein
VLGVGLSAQTPAAAASPRMRVASREKTVLGVAPVTTSGRQGQLRPLDKEKSLHHVDDLPAWPDEPPTVAMAAPLAAALTTQSQRHEESPYMEKGAAAPAEDSLPMDLVFGNEPAEPGVAAPAAERSLAIDLSVRRRAPAPSPAAQPVHKASAAGEPSIPAGESGERRGLSRSSAPGELRETSVPHPRRRSTWRGIAAFVFLLLVLTVAGGGYVYRARLWPWIARYPALRTALARIAPTSTQTPSSSPSSVTPGESATASTQAASQSAIAKLDADAGARVQSATLDASADVGIANAPTHPLAPHAPKHRPAAARQAPADDER